MPQRSAARFKQRRWRPSWTDARRADQSSWDTLRHNQSKAVARARVAAHQNSTVGAIQRVGSASPSTSRPITVGKNNFMPLVGAGNKKDRLRLEPVLENILRQLDQCSGDELWAPPRQP